MVTEKSELLLIILDYPLDTSYTCFLFKLYANQSTGIVNDNVFFTLVKV